MNIKGVIRTRLLTSSALTTIVDDRIYDSIAPQGAARPLVVLDRNSVETFNDLSGTGGVEKAEIIIEHQSDGQAEANDMAAAAQAVLDDFDGVIDGVTVDGIFFEETATDVYDKSETGERSGPHGVQQRINVYYKT